MKIALSLLSFWGVFLSLSLASASVVLHLSEKQMTLRAKKIVRGRVVKRVSRWDAQKRRIYTYTTLTVLDSHKGQTPQEVTIRQVGGVVGNLGMRVPGSARFQVGEEVFVFLEEAQKTPYYHVMAMSYGKFTVLVHPKTKMRYLVRNLHGLSLAGWNKQGRFQLKRGSKASSSIQPIELKTLVHRIRETLRQAPPARPLSPARPAVRRPQAPARPVKPVPARPAPAAPARPSPGPSPTPPPPARR